MQVKTLLRSLIGIRRNKLRFFQRGYEGYVLDSINVLTLVVTPSGVMLVSEFKCTTAYMDCPVTHSLMPSQQSTPDKEDPKVPSSSAWLF